MQTVTHVVPAADTGQEVTDYDTASVTTYPVSGGTVTIPLGEDPLLIEETEGERIYLPLISNTAPLAVSLVEP